TSPTSRVTSWVRSRISAATSAASAATSAVSAATSAASAATRPPPEDSSRGGLWRASCGVRRSYADVGKRLAGGDPGSVVLEHVLERREQTASGVVLAGLECGGNAGDDGRRGARIAEHGVRASCLQEQ